MTILAQIIRTGEIIEVQKISDYDNHGKYIGYYFQTTKPPFKTFNQDELDFEYESRYYPDYWTRLEHQAAITAMQGMMSNPSIDIEDSCNAVVTIAKKYSHALVEKMKEERK